MSKKQKKQRAKAQKAQVRRQSGITLRAVTPPVTVAKVIELKKPDASRTAAEAPASASIQAAPETRPAIVPPTLELETEVAAPAEAAPAASVAPIETEASAPAAPSETEASAPEAKAPVAEHRSSRRFSVAVHIHWWSESHFFSDLSGDISEGGLFLSTYRPLTAGAEVDVEFTLPGTERAVHARGKVRWVRDHSAELPRGVGIAFESLSEDDREVIHEFCTSRPPLYYEDVG